MSDELAQREMTLKEWMARLPVTHTANVELAALERELAEARVEVQRLRESAKCGVVGDASVAAARGADGPGSPSPTDPVAAALAWCNQPLMVVGDSEQLNALAVARMHAANLAAEVRRLQAAHTMQVGLLEACEDLSVQLESAKRRQQQAEADRDSAVALYGVERADRQQAEAEVRRLQAEVANWQRKELIKGSCCADNQHRAEQAETALAAERIENTHLREAFVTMEKAYNVNEAQRCETVRRLEAWAQSNNEERRAGKVPTFLNPHTVLLWMSGANAESRARREP